MVALDVVRPKSSALIDLMEGAADISGTCMRFIESEGCSPVLLCIRLYTTTKTLNSLQGLFRRETGKKQKGFEP